jgi:uncharacterized membrane protein YcaP (DUF421 family)
MNGGDNSITGGLISAATLISVNYLVGFLTYRSKTLEGIIEGRPVILIHNGHVDHRALRSMQITTHELNAALREAGCTCPEEARFAVIENNGHITVITNGHKA